MFIVDETILWLRQTANRGSFVKIAGAADFESAKESQSPDQLPQLFVIATDMSVSDNEDQGTGLMQKVTQTVCFLVEMNSKPDLRGQTASQQAISLFKELNSHVLWGFVPPSIADVARQRGFYFKGAKKIQTNRAQLWWEFYYAIDYYISDDDGVQLTGIPLQSIIFQDGIYDTTTQVNDSTYNLNGGVSDLGN